MIVRHRVFYWRIFLGVSLSCAPTADLPAATSSTSSLFSDSREEPSDVVDLGRVVPVENPGQKMARDISPRTGNPLWSVPLSELSATRERPIFFASRRALPRAVASAPIEPVNVPQAVAAPDVERPPLALVGTVIGTGDAIAVFLHQPSQSIVRLRAGESNAGWSVASVAKGEVVLTRAGRAETFILPPPNPGGPAASR